jgi:serine protease
MMRTALTARSPIILVFLTFTLFTAPLLYAVEHHGGVKLVKSSLRAAAAVAPQSSDKPQTDPSGDSYSLAPLLQDSEFAHPMSDAQAATTQRFDEQWKSGGMNQFGTTGGTLGIIEKVERIDGGLIQVSVQVTALNAQGQAEPWVDARFAGDGFVSWRLDIGTNLGGSNPLNPDKPFKVVRSGISVFNSAGDRLADLDLLQDSSTSTGLAGIGGVELNNGDDIAGFDLATIIMFWNLEEVEDTGFKVTGGQSGAMYDPSHDGEGFVLQIVNETTAVVYWFTYDTQGNQYWMIGVGTVSGSRVTFTELQSTRGGRFGPNFDPDDVVYTFWGTLEFVFSDCDNAVVTYTGPPEFGSGTLNVTRLSRIWGNSCSGGNNVMSGSGLGLLGPGFSGSWYDLRHDGEGFTIEILDETTALIYWFTYDADGNQAWMLAIAEIQGTSIFALDVLITSGGRFGPGFDPDEVVTKTWGAAVFTFGTCTSSGHGGAMRYLPPPEFGPESTQLLNRLVFISSIDCKFLADTHNITGNMTVAENIFIDGDVNNTAIEEFPNDLDSGVAQQLIPPAKVAGFVTAEPTGEEGDRFEFDRDEWDIYLLSLREGEGVSLVVSDWNPQDMDEVDLDLYIVDVNDSENTADSSVTVDEVETVVAPYDGNFFVYVHAVSGRSNYLLQSGQSGQETASLMDVTSKFTSGQVLAALRDPARLTAAGGDDQARIEQFEARHGLNRLRENSAGEILYQIDRSQTWRLAPHPLTAAGIGSVTPEQWQVIRTSKSLAANPDYRWAGPNYIYQTHAVPNDTFYDLQWHYQQIRMPGAWDVTTGREDVYVAVLDSGVYRHPDFGSNVDFALGYDFVDDVFASGDGDGIDSDAGDPGELYPANQPYISHGTHVAGTVGARGNNNTGITGVNWRVTIMPVRVCGFQGCSCWSINEGMRWAGRLPNASGTAPSERAQVVNMSLGGSSPCPGSQDIINQLASRGIVITASAGNEGNSILSYPASSANVVSVSATTLADELAYYSTYGSRVDIAAPGGDSTADLNNDSYQDGVLSNRMIIKEGSATIETDYGFLQGTSMAAPHVAGIAALMKSVFPDMGPGEFDTAIASGKITNDLAQNGETTRDDQFGYGRVDALKAVQWAVAAESGEESAAFMTSSTSALDFGANMQSLELVIGRAGSGDLAISDVGWSESWISVSSVDVNANQFGSYRVSLNRGGLLDGQYSGWIAFDADNGTRLWVSVLMRVGEKAEGEAGYVYGLLLDPWTLQNVKFWHGPQTSSGFDILLRDNPPGTYYLMVGTDLDNDFTICDEGELCELYPSNSQVTGIEVENRDLELGTFRMSFPVPVLRSAREGSGPVTNAMAPEGGEVSALPKSGRITATRPRD